MVFVANKFELDKYGNLLRELVVRDIRKKYRRSILGILWSMLNPILIMLIMSFVFSQLFRFEIRNYPMYLITGQVVFNFFAESTNFSLGSILENGSLIKKIYVPKFLFTVSRVISSLVNLIFTLPAVVFIAIITGNPISWYIFSCVIAIILLCIFCLGISLFLATLTVFFRDMFHLYGVILTALSYATPIFYPLSIIPEEYRWVSMLNPLVYYLKLFRCSVYENAFPELSLIIICCFLSFFTLVIGGYFFCRNQQKFILYL